MNSIKKQLVYLLFIIFSTAINAQKKTIYYGKPSTGGAEVHVFEDNTYKVIKNEDTFQTFENKYIVFGTPEIDQSRFTVISNTGTKADSITISVSAYDITFAENVYIGYKQNANEEYKYVNLIIESRLFNTTPDSKSYQFKIPRANYLQFASQEEYINKVYMESFKLPKNTANIYFDYKYRYKKKGSFKMFAEIDATGKLIVNDRLFSTDNPKGDNVKKIATDSIKDWTVPLQVEKEAYKKFDNPKLKYQPEFDISPTEYEDEFSGVKSLEEALTMVKADESNILLIFNQLLDNNAAAYFEEFARELKDNSTMYDYNAHLKNFIVYLTKPEDRKALRQFNSNSVNEVIVVNSDIEILYTEQIWTNKFRNKYGTSLSGENLDKKLLALNTIHIIAQNIKTKTTSAKDFLDLEQVEDKDFLFKNINGKRKHTSVTYAGERENIKKRKSISKFYLKNITTLELKNELTRIIEEHKTNKKVDLDFAQLALNYISHNYNYDDLIGYDSYIKSKFYFEFCHYLSRFAMAISKTEVKHSSYENNIFLIGYGLKTKGAAQYPELVIETYKNLMKLKEFNAHFVSNYLNYVIANNKKPFNAFDAFFKSIIAKNKDFKKRIEQYYNTNIKTKDEIHPHNGINRLSDQISKAANTVAWEVVTKHQTNKDLINKALVWSEMSLEIEPENHYYLDTYAHLLYFTGNIEKATQIESEAIKLATQEKDEESVKGYTDTLNKIKNGTL